MRDEIAIVAPAVDHARLRKRVAAARDALDAAEHEEREDVARAERSRETTARRRLELGRELIEARKAHPRGTWLPFLAEMGIHEQSAREWMNLAGYVEKISKPSGDGLDNPPTRREVQAARREVVMPAAEPPLRPALAAASPVLVARAASPEPTILVATAPRESSESLAFASLIHMLGAVARQWPGEPTRLVAELRRYADKLERRIQERGTL